MRKKRDVIVFFFVVWFFALGGHMATLQRANKIVWPARSYSPTATATRSPSWSPSPRPPHISSGIPTLIKSSNEQLLKTREKNILAKISEDVDKKKLKSHLELLQMPKKRLEYIRNEMQAK